MLWSEGVAIPNENIPHTLTQCREGVALDLHKVTLQDRTQEWESAIWKSTARIKIGTTQINTAANLK